MNERIRFHVSLDVGRPQGQHPRRGSGVGPGAGRLIGKVTHDVVKRHKVLAKIGTPVQLHVVYEAGPTGVGLQPAARPNQYRQAALPATGGVLARRSVECRVDS